MFTIIPSKNSVLIMSVSDTYNFSASSCTDIALDNVISVGFSPNNSFPESFLPFLLLPCFSSCLRHRNYR